MSISIVQNPSPPPGQEGADPAASSAGRQQGADLESGARLFRALLAAPDSSHESGEPAASDKSGYPHDSPSPATTGSQDHPVAERDPDENPWGSSMSARDLAIAALWSGSADRTDTSPDQRGATHSPTPRSHRLGVLNQPALDGAAIWSPPAQPQPLGPSTAVSFPDPSIPLTALIEMHIRRTLISCASDGSSPDEVRLELSDAVLPETTLTLKREPGGWQLAVVTANPQSRERITRHADALVKRFAAASLGSLRVVSEVDEAIDR